MKYKLLVKTKVLIKEYPFNVVSLVTIFGRFLQDLKMKNTPKECLIRNFHPVDSFLMKRILTLLQQFKKLITAMSYSNGNR